MMAPPEMMAKLQAMDVELRGDISIADNGHLDIAKRRLETALENYPSEFFAIPLMDVDIRSADYIAAYKVAVPFVKLGASQGLLVRASLAAAAVGEAYDGQREYLVGTIARGATRNQFAEELPQGESTQILLALSAFSIANEYGDTGDVWHAIPFAELALQAAPGNSLFCSGLARCYSGAMQYSKAITVLEQGLPNATSQYRLSVMSLMLNNCRSCLSAVGDGHPFRAGQPRDHPAVQKP
jgi:tetratricopeptide (TPR) repeat protein